MGLYSPLSHLNVIMVVVMMMFAVPGLVYYKGRYLSIS